MSDSSEGVNVGAWGEPTSSIDWCEDNYAVSYYVAEWWNTLSNIPIVILCILAWHKAHHRSTFLPPHLRSAYLWLLLVFCGSTVFHATLSYAGQLLDELPMIAGVCAYHVALSSRDSVGAFAGRTSTRIATATTLAIGLLMYLLRDSPLPLQLSYGSLTVALVVRSVMLYRSVEVPARRSLFLAMLVYGSAFLLWITECAICGLVKPFAFHAWWHLLSGTGTLIWIQFLAAYVLGSSRTVALVHHPRGLAHILPFIAIDKTVPSTESHTPHPSLSAVRQ
ncbi:alkaline ceramidase 3 [Thecamonas trahens ATCC 50062]|uniref:Alkaline ceramidase 3 n=1 Tax=Thecamonas trahens ATCC 50062 TaxID=461836 RepID=A0A0L0DAG9_THETB|nr:alkaline ceramidase 3 [Thecamonas trahens ATCC 50062]KNC49359.1 alkaline ceramidase 3 [Thecamonas trahens ATCC 50062]|eukprot:XP_013757784.1 alkaline ceramidase 3 [Thecamonas trahens ATCC 50062]